MVDRKRFSLHRPNEPGQSGPIARAARRLGVPAATVVLAAVVALVGVGGALAWLTVSHSLENVFGVGTVDPDINEGFNNTVKSNVFVTNNGTVDAYLRARVDIYWVDANGRIMSDMPISGTDYTIEWGGASTDGSSWVYEEGGTVPANALADGYWVLASDGFYYWSLAVEPESQTKNLIDKAEQAGTGYSDGRKLVVDVASQAIQANPADAVEEAWGVTVGSDGTLSFASGLDGGA